MRAIFGTSLLALIATIVFSPSVRADTPTAPVSVRIGYIGSLSGFAAEYGNAVLNGAQLAAEEERQAGAGIELFVEDDQSLPKNTLTAYQKLKNVDDVQVVISGSWWINGIVKAAERDHVLLLSAETLYNKDFIKAPNYFSLAGDLRDWARVYEPLIKQQGWKRGAMVRFVSGFADTLEEELRAVTERSGASLVKVIEYSDVEMKESSTLATSIKSAHPDFLYVDSQPSSFADFAKHLSVLKTENMALISHSVALDAFRQKLFDPGLFNGTIYFTARDTYRPEFVNKYEKRYQEAPKLNSDLGYYAVRLAIEAHRRGGDPAETLRKTPIVVDGLSISFDENNVFRGIEQKVFKLSPSGPEKLR